MTSKQGTGLQVVTQMIRVRSCAAAGPGVGDSEFGFVAHLLGSRLGFGVGCHCNQARQFIEDSERPGVQNGQLGACERAAVPTRSRVLAVGSTWAGLLIVDAEMHLWLLLHPQSRTTERENWSR